MATYTQNYNLKKPATTDNYDVNDFNENFEIIDEKIKEISEQGVAVDSALSETSENPVQNKVISTALKDKASAPVTVNDTLSASGWSDKQYTWSNVNIKSVSQPVILTYGNVMSTAQIEALNACMIKPVSQSVGSITFECAGDVPTIDIPVSFVILGV